jgi:capsular polysaccharide transport system permease protein
MADTPFSYRRATTFPEQFGLVVRVWIALVLRETKTRFGRNKLGFLWALIEPLVFVGLFLLIRGGLRDRNIPFGQDLALFLVTGLLAFRMFMSVASRGLGAIVSNLALIAYPPVRPLDVIFARVGLEILTMYVIWTISLCLLSIFVEGKVIVDYVRFAAAMAALTYLSVSVATFNGVVAVLWPTWERLWGFLRLPLLILTGILFLPTSMPLSVQAVMAWNPILHAVEWIRTAIYMTYDPVLSVPYLLGFSTVTLCIALVLERGYRYKIYS